MTGMDTAVEVAGVGMHPFGRFPERSLKDLVRVAVVRALVDAGIGTKDVQAVYSSNGMAGVLQGQEQIRGQSVLRDVGIERGERDPPGKRRDGSRDRHRGQPLGERQRRRLYDERRDPVGQRALLAPADDLAIAPARARGRRSYRGDLEPGMVRQQADELLADRAGGTEHADRDLRCHGASRARRSVANRT
jgi:hypothetical protein